MKIPNSMRRFAGDGALLIVAGKQDAVFYKVENDSIVQTDAFKMPTPRYSDNEGSYGVPGRGSVTGSGGTRERKDDDVVKDFLREFKDRTKRLDRSISDIFIFASEKIKNKIAETLPADLRGKVIEVIEGNYFASSPLELLEKAIGVRMPASEPVVLNPEAKKILDIGLQR